MRAIKRPGCYRHEPGEVTARAPWAKDKGRACMQASRPEWWNQLLKAEPGCQGCARADRAKLLYWTADEIQAQSTIDRQ